MLLLWKRALKSCKEEIQTLEAMLNQLDDVERTVIEEKLFIGLGWLDIAELVNYSERSCRNILTNAFKKLETCEVINE